MQGLTQQKTFVEEKHEIQINSQKGFCARAYGLGSQCRPNECILGSGKPRGVGISGGRVYEPGEEMGKLVYEQPGNEVDGSCHSKEGSK
jgi:hypothetical protein